MSINKEVITDVIKQMKGFPTSFEISGADILNAMSKIYTPGPSFYSVFDFSTKEFDYISPHVQNVLGVNMAKSNVGDLMNLIHPDDLEHIRKCQNIADTLFHDILGINSTSHYKRSYQFRMKRADGPYRLMLQQSVMLLTQEDKIAGKSFGYTSDITHVSNHRNSGISFIDLTGSNSFHNIQSVNQLLEKINASRLLSDREIEIMKLLSEGYKSKEIAETLKISYDTVRTHRNNILKKKDFKNISHAIAYYIREGML